MALLATLFFIPDKKLLDKESKVNENKINLKHNSDTIILWLL